MNKPVYITQYGTFVYNCSRFSKFMSSSLTHVYRDKRFMRSTFMFNTDVVINKSGISIIESSKKYL